eukprot:s664_g15.t1
MVFCFENNAEQSVCIRGSSCADSNLEVVEIAHKLGRFFNISKTSAPREVTARCFSMKTLKASTAVQQISFLAYFGLTCIM